MIGLLNTLALVLAFCTSLLAFSRWGTPPPPAAAPLASMAGAVPAAIATQRAAPLAPGVTLTDQAGQSVPLKAYQRIASASTVADSLLLEFAEPTRIAAFTHYHKDSPLTGFRYQGRPQIDAVHDFETLLGLQPDLLIVSTLSSTLRLERLREAGLTVFVLGEMRGLDAYLDSALAVSALVGKAELGREYAKSFRRRMASVAANLPASGRKTALQLVYYGRELFGSGKDTSYYDVLRAAGLEDLGAVHFTGWPSLTLDQVLVLDPDVIVTRIGMGAQLCSQGSLARLRACHASRGIVELSDELLNDPGPMMLPSAEQIYDAVYGP
jgi:iron complex transport system substrate-binding protein